MPETDNILAESPVDDSADEAADSRHEQITEILAELRGAPEDEEGDDLSALEDAEEPEPEPEPAAEPDEPADAIEEPAPEAPAPEPPAEPAKPAREPAPRPAPPPASAPPPAAPAAWMVPAFLGLVVAIFGLGTWVIVRHVASNSAAVAEALSSRPAPEAAPRPRPEPPATSAPAAPAEPVPPVDRGLRYTQKMDEAAQLFEQADYQAAAAAYRQALVAMPPNWNDGAAAFRLGQAYFHLGNYPLAIEAYRRVASAFGHEYQARALFQLGECHLALGNHYKARAAFYDLLLTQDRYGPEAKPWIENARYRVAEAYWQEAERLRTAGRGTAPREGTP